MRRRTREDNPLPLRLQRYVASEWQDPRDWYLAWREWRDEWHAANPDAQDGATLRWWLAAAQTAPSVPFDQGEI